MPLTLRSQILSFFVLFCLPDVFGGEFSQLPQDHSRRACPGVIISEVRAPVRFLGYPISPIYVSDPCILVLSNGDYLAAHAFFGSASGAGSNGKTCVFRSTDQGTTWTKVNGGNDINGLLRGSLFEQGGAAYLLGSNKDSPGSVAVISQSDNNGETWTSPTSLSPLLGMATPGNVLKVGNRLWIASTTSAVFKEQSTDPMLATSWSRVGGFPAASDSWMPTSRFNAADNFIGEGQISYSPGEGLVILSKVRMLPYTALARVNPVSGRVSFDPKRDFIPLPGGEKKFSIRYDPISGKFFLLSNPILAAHKTSIIAPDLIRNTAAVFSSPDLRNWKLEKIFLYAANPGYEGFQYFNFEFDRGDIVLVSRTAFDVGGNKPPRAHDSNLLTFHRIPNFRTLAREIFLRIECGQVRRFERTQLDDAPLGVFPRGTHFDKQALTSPCAMGLNASCVYIREDGGRILKFDLSGNFLGTVLSAPSPLQSADLNIPAPIGREFNEW